MTDAVPFSNHDREQVRDRIVEIARADVRVTGVAFVGSGAVGALDEWSDLDITCGVRSGNDPAQVLADFTRLISDEFGLIDHFDVHRGDAIYRVMLFGNGLEVDLSAAPESEFGQLGPHFALVQGTAIDRPRLPAPSPRGPMGWGWHHVLHANSAINRGRAWQAVFWINSLRDQLLTLMLIRHGLPSAQARGAHEIPPAELAPLEESLTRSTDPAELRRSISVLSSLYLEELARHNPDLAARVRTTLDLVVGRATAGPM